MDSISAMTDLLRVVYIKLSKGFLGELSSYMFDSLSVEIPPYAFVGLAEGGI